MYVYISMYMHVYMYLSVYMNLLCMYVCMYMYNYDTYSITTDPKLDTTRVIDSKSVTVPQGKPIPMSKYSNSSFSQVKLSS